MAKIIKLTSECVNEIRKDFEEVLSTAKLSDGKINFTKSFGSIKREATVYFTELAWLKMQTLVREFDKEIGWHGIAKRGDNAEKDEYIISDILVYPQEVTGTTVNTDQEKYQMWLIGHDDEVFNNIRMQGHSHVNMGVTPSGVDTSLYDRILDQLDDDMFYIFMIWNKRGEKTIKIYDLAKNVLFETSDCTVKILDDGTGIEKFLKDAKDMVKDKVYTHLPQPDKGCTEATAKAENKPNNDNKSPTASNKKKGKRRGNRNNGGMSNASTATLYDDWEDWDDVYSAFGRRSEYYY